MSNRKISREDLLIFFREMLRIVNQNMPLDEALKLIASEQKGAIPEFAFEVEYRLKRGMPLSEALKDMAHVNPYTIALIRSGEESGCLSEMLEVVVKFYRRSVIARKTILESLRYPGIIMAMFLMLNFVIGVKIIPEMQDIYAQLGAELPSLTMLIINVYNFFLHKTYILLFVILFFVFYILLRRTSTIKIFESNLILMIPLIGNSVLMDSLGRFCNALGSLMKRNVNLDTALVLASSSVENLISKKALGAVAARISKGGKLSDGLDSSGLFSSTSVWMIKKSEERGDVEDALLEIAAFYDERFMDIRQKVFTIMEPLLIVLIGLFVGMYVVALFLPLFNIPRLI